MDLRLVLVHAVDHECSTTPDIVDALIRQFLHSRCLHNDIKPILVIVFQLLPLRFRVLPIQLNVLVTGVELLGNIHLDALVGCDDHPRCTVQLEELGEDETCGTGTENEDFNSDRRRQLV